MGKLLWIIWVGSKCNHKGPCKREGVSQRRRLWDTQKQMLLVQLTHVKMEEGAISQGRQEATRS